MSAEDLGKRLPIEQELTREKAGSLARAGERLDKALAELTACDRALSSAVEPQLSELRARRLVLRAEAAERLWYLIVQREAVGLHHHEPVYQLYGVPRELRLHAGPRRANGR